MQLHFQPASLNENQLTVLIERFVRVSRSRFRWHGNLASSTCRQSVILRTLPSEAYDDPLIGPDKTWRGSAPVVLRTGIGRARFAPYRYARSNLGNRGGLLCISRGTLGTSQTRPVNPQLLHFVDERRALHAKLVGGALGAADYPTDLLKRL